MNENPEQDITSSESQLLDGLLHRAMQGDDNAADDQRVDELMATIRHQPTITAPATSAWTPKRASGRTRLYRWLAAPLAAVAVWAVLIYAPAHDPSRAAVAALDRIIQAEQTPLTREYAVDVHVRSLGGKRVKSHQLFVRQRDFVLRSPALFGKRVVWAGGSNGVHWLAPPRGAVLVGDEGLLRREAQRRVIETPFLSVATILERMKRFYDLELNAGVSLQQTIESGAVSIRCDHIVGKRARQPRNGASIPARVDVWADGASGFARRVVLTWDADDASRWSRVSAELIAASEKDDAFFLHTSHHEPDRKVIHVDRAD